MSEKNSNDIFEILGIDPSKTSEGSYNLTPEKLHEEVVDPSAPSGSIFDNYSNYPKDPDNYWWHFRVWTILGLIVFFSPIIFYCFESLSDKLPFSNKPSSEDFATVWVEEVTTEEIVQPEEVVVAEEPQMLSGSNYYSGSINDKYDICMYLDFDAGEGKYYYVRSGADNCMTLAITNIEYAGETSYGESYLIEMNEFNPSGDICGMWRGTLSAEGFSGTGEFLGKTMPFELNECRRYQTEF